MFCPDILSQGLSFRHCKEIYARAESHSSHLCFAERLISYAKLHHFPSFSKHYPATPIITFLQCVDNQHIYFRS